MKFSYDIFGLTDKGPVRPVNEDHILVGRILKNRGGVALGLEVDDDFLTSFGLVCAVADGVGGETGGALASQRALHAFDAQFYSYEKGADNRKSYREGLLSAGDRANRTLLSLQKTRPELASMGCTLSGVCLTSDGLLAFNAGDSRVSRWRDGYLKQITRDDSLSALAVAANLVTAEQAAQSDACHTLLNVVGSAKFALAMSELPTPHPGDCILVCSDGLHGSVPLEEQETAFGQGGSAIQMARRLLGLAFKHGTRDNVSFIVIRCAEAAESVAHNSGKPAEMEASPGDPAPGIRAAEATT